MQTRAPTFFADSLPHRYRVEECLSYGETAATFRVQDTGLRQAPAVVKIQLLGSESEASAFIDFCDRLAQIRRPHIATPYTYGTTTTSEGQVLGYSVRSYVPGQSLADIDLPLDERSCVRVATHVLHALGALHAHSLLHHDLKLENVVVRRGGPAVDELAHCVLIDLSYRPQTARQQNALSEVTFQYVAPELLQGAVPTPQSDLYSLGVLLYGLLAGTLPFSGTSAAEVIRNQRSRNFHPISSFRKDLSGTLVNVVEQLLEPYPENRPDGAQALLAAFEELRGPERRTGGVEVQACFFGRDAEVSKCMETLASPSVAVAVDGAAKSGVTSFLREIQDRAEADGAVVLTARPQAIAGASIQSQLFEPVQSLVRQACRGDYVADPRSDDPSTTDLLDDVFVASGGRRIVLFVDDWHLCNADELGFLRRLIRQGAAAVRHLTSREGKCQVVLGTTSGSPDSEIQLCCKRHSLEPWTRHDLQELLMFMGMEHITSANCETILASTAEPGRIVDILLAVPEAADARALKGVVASKCAPASVQSRSAPDTDQAIVAIALWGSWLTWDEWLNLRREFDLEPQRDSSELRVELTGSSRRVRISRPEASKGFFGSLAGEYIALLAGRLRSVVKASLASNDEERLLAHIRFLARSASTGLRWVDLRVMLQLLRTGCFAEVEAATTELLAVGCECAWLPLVRLAARIESGNSRDVGEEPATNVALYASYSKLLRARGLWRTKHESEAAHLLEDLSGSDEVHPLVRSRATQECAVFSSERGDARRARGLFQELRRRAAHIATQIAGDAWAVRGSWLYAQLLRVRHRLCARVGRLHSAARGARLECRLREHLEDRLGQAASVNNLGVYLLRAGRIVEAKVALEDCA
ncbi:MAG: serine/threonine-protein kinase, partial [Planctomycetota bacterium]